jgi:hypothetical protein
MPSGLELITRFMDEQGIEYEVVEHSRSTTAIMEARAVFSGGDHDHGVLIDPNDLVQIVQPRVADVCAD